MGGWVGGGEVGRGGGRTSLTLCPQYPPLICDQRPFPSFRMSTQLQRCVVKANPFQASRSFTAARSPVNARRWLTVSAPDSGESQVHVTSRV